MHKQIQDNLEARVREKHPTARILTNVSYSIPKPDEPWEYWIGESDVLAKLPRYTIFYEVKCHGRYDKALEQFHRYCESHPHKRVKGVYVSADRVRRLR